MDSLQAIRIAGGNTAYKRASSDFYPTPPDVTFALMKFLCLEESAIKLVEATRDYIASLSAADVAEVTFCKDCRYYQDAKVNEKGFLICPASGMEITVTDFCSYGRRQIETVLTKSEAKDESLEADHD